MDGIAINFHHFNDGKRDFPIEGTAAAGMPVKRLNDDGNCLEVMTGSIMPSNADTVVRYET